MRKPNTDVLFVTALEEERDALLAKLEGHKRIPPAKGDTRVYYQADLPTLNVEGATSNYRMVLMPLGGMGRTRAAAATSDALRRWRPRCVVLVGIAGGIQARGVGLGDVLVADQIVDYELQKLTVEGIEVRWEIHRADEQLLNEAKALPASAWHAQSVVTPPVEGHVPKRHIAPVARGDKVAAVASFLSTHREHWPTISGIEMEAGGVAHVCFTADPKPAFLMIRGVSDLADEQKDSANVKAWRSYATDLAATYAIALLRSAPLPPP